MQEKMGLAGETQEDFLEEGMPTVFGRRKRDFSDELW